MAQQVRFPIKESDTLPPAQSERRPTRRSFVASASAVSTLAVVGGPLVQNAAGSDRDKTRTRPPIRWYLNAVREEQAFGDDSTLPVFRFVPGRVPQQGSGIRIQTAGRLPVLDAFENQYVTVTIRNTLDFPVQPTIVGFLSGPVIMPKNRADWSFRMPDAGTWLLTEALLGPAGGAVGFGATLISRARIPENGGYNIAREHVLLYQNIDDRWNLALDAGDQPDTSTYEPNYHIVNGLTAPHTKQDPSTTIGCNVGENVLIRMGNLGHFRHSIHFHGYHADMIKRNNEVEEMLPMKDTFPLPAYSTAEIVLPVIQDGVYPIHPHSLTATTANGSYPFGQISFIDATE